MALTPVTGDPDNTLSKPPQTEHGLPLLAGGDVCRFVVCSNVSFTLHISHVERLSSIRPRSPLATVKVDHEPVAYIDEHFPLTIDVTNEEAVELDMQLEVYLQPNDDGSST